MVSIYHFFASLLKNKAHFKTVSHLSDFPFEKKQLACQNQGVFPDLALRINKDKEIFTGGELIELKDSDSYTVSSFNSTIPTGTKNISQIITSENSIIKRQMIDAGNDIYSLPVREVFYLIRGRKRDNVKVCLVHGSFFETIKVEELINRSFIQVFQERLDESGKSIPEEYKEVLLSIFSEQKNFSRVRNVDRASVKLRFRIMTEVKAEGNILNPKKYPEIVDNSLNLVLPCHNPLDEQDILDKAKLVFNQRTLKELKRFKIKHHFNGYFFVFQATIT